MDKHIIPLLFMFTPFVQGNSSLLRSILNSQDFLKEVEYPDVFVLISEDEETYWNPMDFPVKVCILHDLLKNMTSVGNALVVDLAAEASIGAITSSCPSCKVLVKRNSPIPPELLTFDSRIYAVEELSQTSSVHVYEVYKAADQVITNLILDIDSSQRSRDSLLYIWDRRKNLRLMELKIIGSAVGFFMRHDTEENSFNGPFIEILDYLRNELNFTYTILLHPENLYGLKQSDGTWNGRIGMILDGQGDMVMSGMSINKERAEVIDFGPVISKGYVTFFMMDPFNNKVLDATAYIDIFVAESWLVHSAVGIALIASLGLFWSSQEKSPLSACSKAFSAVVPSFILLSGDVGATEQAGSSRVLLLTIWVTLYLVFQMYASGLTSLMTANNKVINLRSFRDLYDQDYELNCIKGSSYETLLKRSNPGSALYDFYYHRMRPDNFFPGFDELVEDSARNPQAAYLTTDFSNPLLALRSYTIMGKLDDSIVDLLAPVFPKRSPYKEVISYHLNKMLEAGLIDRVYKRWQLRKSLSPLNASPFQCFPLSIEHVTFLLVVLSSGFAAGIVLSLGERLYHNMKK